VGWDSLTASELGVARLAAEGLTNPQIGDRLFVSPRTVATHLASVFRKLGITNRVQLAAEASRRAGAT
jgi:DNA-binding CsgD family transcriptional regulator